MIDRNQVKAELAMRIRFAAGGTTPVSAVLLENVMELLEEDEKKLNKISDLAGIMREGNLNGNQALLECESVERAENLMSDAIEIIEELTDEI